MFLYAFSNEDKELLEANGYKMLCEKIVSDKKAFIFADNNKLNFAKDLKVLKTNRLYF